MKTIIGIVVLVGLMVGVYMLNDLTRGPDRKSILNVAGKPELIAEFATPETRVIVRVVQAPGEVEPFSEVDISAEVAGKILEMPVEEGDMVKAGDLLCRLDDALYRSRVVSAQAKIAMLDTMIVQSNAELDQAERDYRRQERLSEANATSSIELAEYYLALSRATTTVEIKKQEQIEAKAFLQSAQEDQAKTVIETPIDGVVSQLFAKKGEVVITGTMNNPGTRIMVISDLSKMQVRCRVDETDAALVVKDQVARIFLQSNTREAIRGHVDRVATKGTKPTGRDVVTFETVVMVDDIDARVRPGMTANVEIEVARREDVLTIPVEAVVARKRRDLPDELVAEFDRIQAALNTAQRRQTAQYISIVFCSVDGVADPRLVATGISDETGVEITSGLAPDDLVVVGPYRTLDQVKKGDKLKTEEDESLGDEPGEGEPVTVEKDSADHPDEVADKDANETESKTATHDEADGSRRTDSQASTDATPDTGRHADAGTNR